MVIWKRTFRIQDGHVWPWKLAKGHWLSANKSCSDTSACKCWRRFNIEQLIMIIWNGKFMIQDEVTFDLENRSISLIRNQWKVFCRTQEPTNFEKKNLLDKMKFWTNLMAEWLLKSRWRLFRGTYGLICVPNFTKIGVF